MASVGVEIEMPVAERSTGDPYGATSRYFENIHRQKIDQGESAVLKSVGGRHIAVETSSVLTSLDNAFNNLESSIGPVSAEEDELTVLDRAIHQELEHVRNALIDDDATVINFSEHPNTAITPGYYHRMRAPKPIYDYWVGYRRWNHMCGIDAKAHNGPTTGVNFQCAVEALNVVLAASPAFIALYANSPFEAGRPSGYMENRLTIWPRMFSCSRFPCDDRLHRMPSAPFKDLRDYFSWMFGPGTSMHFVTPSCSSDYKKPESLVVIQGDPPLLEFLTKPAWKGKDLHTSEEFTVTPSMAHLAFNQFAHFLDARIRYALSDAPFECSEFFEAMERGEGRLEELFAGRTRFCYIEGRAPGANFPDEQIRRLGHEKVSKSVVISPSAIQKGLITNLVNSKKLLSRYRWTDLAELRRRAVRYGLKAEFAGIRVKDYCRDILELAAGGLPSSEHWMFAYPEFVLSLGKNGADRAVEDFERLPGNTDERIRKIVLKRKMIIP